MEIAARGWGRNHGENLVVKRDLEAAKIGRFESYARAETYITPKLQMTRSGSSLRDRGLVDEPSVEIRFDAKIVLNGDYLVRLALNRNEIASLFFSLYADCSLEELLDQFNKARLLRDIGPLPSLLFDAVMLKKVDDLKISVRSANCLKNDNITYIGDLVQKTEADMLRTPNFGRKSTNEIKEVLAQMNLYFGMKVPGWPPENIKELAQRFNDLNQD